jgi:hypothetical protein
MTLRKLRVLIVIIVSVCAIAPGVATGVEQAYEPKDLPGPLQSLLSDQHIVIYVANGSSSWDARDADDTITYSLQTDDSANIESFNRTVSGEKSFEILLDRSVLTEAVQGDAVQQDLLDVYRDGVIKYRGVGFWNSALVTATKTTISAGTSIYSGVSSVASLLR